MRKYTKLFKGDISRKTNYFKCEEFAGIDALDVIAQDIKTIDLVKEQVSINKCLKLKHN